MLTQTRQFHSNLSFTVRYALLGALFGFAFPIMATGILLWTHAMPISLASVIEFHRTEPLLWIIDTAPFFLGLFASFAGRREDRLRNAYAHLQQDERQLQQLTQQLQWHSAQLMTLSEISSRLSTILDLEALLAEMVNQIKENFGYYHTHIYLLDDKGEKLVVVEGTGRAGAEMKARGHHVDLDAPTSLVARAARSGEIVRIDNVREAEDWLPDPLLPDTCSEIVVPIILEGQVVGVLDVQEDEIAGLDESDADLIRSLANHVAVAIRNARLFAETQVALQEMQVIHQHYLGQAWAEYARGRAVSGYQQTDAGTLPIGDQVLPEVGQAMMEQRPIVQSAPAALAVPIVLRDQPIGALGFRGGDKGRPWSEEDVTLVEAVAEQFALAADNLRLLDEAQRRAAREQLTGEIVDRMRRAVDVDTLLQTALQEVSTVLGVSSAFVQLAAPSEPVGGEGGDGADE